jgi:hypothetical protein
MSARMALRQWMMAVSIFLTVGFIPARALAQGGVLPPAPPPTTTPTPYPPPLYPTPAPAPMPPINPPPAPLPADVRNNFPVIDQEVKKDGADYRIYPHDEKERREFWIKYEEKEQEQEYSLSLELPTPGQLYGRRLSESQWRERQRQEAKRFSLTRKVTFPEDTPLTLEKFKPRHWEQSVARVSPCYLLHDRLYFEQVNFERYGWELGVLGPPVQLATFAYDLALLPYRQFSRPFDQIDGSAGKYLPGDNVPLMLYPEPFSLTGLSALAGTYMFGPFIYK